MATNPDYAGLTETGDYGPDTGHYHVYIEVDGYMVPFSGWWLTEDDGLCWATRDAAWRSVRGWRGAIAVVGLTVPWDDCPGNDNSEMRDAGIEGPLVKEWTRQTN